MLFPGLVLCTYDEPRKLLFVDRARLHDLGTLLRSTIHWLAISDPKGTGSKGLTTVSSKHGARGTIACIPLRELPPPVAQ